MQSNLCRFILFVTCLVAGAEAGPYISRLIWPTETVADIIFIRLNGVDGGPSDIPEILPPGCINYQTGVRRTKTCKSAS